MRFLTADLPGCGGHFKEAPEDFEVEEIPAYLPCGEGEHVYLWVEKRGVATPDAAKRISRHLGLPEGAVSWAGLKDKQALTRQWMSVQAKPGRETELSTFLDPEVKLLQVSRHRNKLKGGHLDGNRFKIRIAKVKDVAAAQATLAVLKARGVPNFFGAQRFGAAGTNAARGKAILLKAAAGGRRGRPDFERKMLLSAYQSELFNRVLDRRLDAGLFSKARQGDVLKKHESGGEFVCADPAVDQPRMDAFEVSPTGPMYGPSMRPAQDEVGADEAKVLAEEGLTIESFAAGGGETDGARRLLRIPLPDVSLEPAGEDAWLSFALPSGAYATVVLGELLKPGPR
ncbi:MAG: tRNA pseudouridine(13) synthase [Myxococcaceae bacterium]|nr:tRNA pseudouridine(13) synthase [Myxococcaceae bacterium]